MRLKPQDNTTKNTLILASHIEMNLKEKSIKLKDNI